MSHLKYLMTFDLAEVLCILNYFRDASWIVYLMTFELTELFKLWLTEIPKGWLLTYMYLLRMLIKVYPLDGF